MENQISILIAEDDDLLAATIMIALDEKGYETRRASTFAEAEAAIVEQVPDLILLDLGLPCRAIEDVILGIKDLAAVSCVIIMTGRGQEPYGVQAFNHGASEFINKPVSLEELTAKIESAYAAHRIKEEAKKSAENLKALKVTFREMINNAGGH